MIYFNNPNTVRFDVDFNNFAVRDFGEGVWKLKVEELPSFHHSNDLNKLLGARLYDSFVMDDFGNLVAVKKSDRLWIGTIKPAPEHFPPGTVVEVNLPFWTKDGKRVIFEVARVVTNGINSFVAETNVKKDTKVFGDMYESFNLQHIWRIVKAGQHPAIVEYSRSRPEWVKQQYDTHAEAQNAKWRYSNARVKSGKTNYVWDYTYESLLLHLFDKHRSQGNNMLDLHTMGEELHRQTFIRASVTSFFEGWGYRQVVCSAPKKRVDAWFKANFNRFLLNLKKEELRQLEEMEEAFERSERSYSSSRDDLDDVVFEDSNEDVREDKLDNTSEFDREDHYRANDRAYKEYEEVFGTTQETPAEKPAVRRVRRTIYSHQATLEADPDRFEDEDAEDIRVAEQQLEAINNGTEKTTSLGEVLKQYNPEMYKQ